MRRNPYSFKLDLRRDPKEVMIDLKTNRSCERNISGNSTSRTTLPKDTYRMDTKPSITALSTSRKTSITIPTTDRSEKKNHTELINKQRIKVKQYSEPPVLQKKDTIVNENASSISTQTPQVTRPIVKNLSYFFKNQNQQLEQSSEKMIGKTIKEEKKGKLKSPSISISKQPSFSLKQPSSQHSQQHQYLANHNKAIQKCEQQKVNESNIVVKEPNSQKQINLQQETFSQKQINLQQEFEDLKLKQKQNKLEIQQLELHFDEALNNTEQQDIQIEFDMVDMTPSMSELRRRLDSQREYSNDGSLSTNSRDSQKPNKQRKQSLEEKNIQFDQILGDIYSTESFECDEKCVGVEISRIERTLDEKLKQSQRLSEPTFFPNEVNIYSSLEFELRKKKLEQPAIEKKLLQTFHRNQFQKKKEESIGSQFLIEYNQTDRSKNKSSAHRTISIIVFDQINEECSKDDLSNFPEPTITNLTNIQTPMLPKRGSIFLHKNNLNFQQKTEKSGISLNNKFDVKRKPVLLSKEPISLLNKRSQMKSQDFQQNKGNIQANHCKEESCTIF